MSTELPDDVLQVLRDAIQKELGPPGKMKPGRVAKGRTGLRALSQRAQVPPSAVSRFLGGERGLSFENARKLAEALGLEMVVTIKEARHGKSK